MINAFLTMKKVINKNCQIRGCLLNIQVLSVAAIMYICFVFVSYCFVCFFFADEISSFSVVSRFSGR